MPPRRKKAKQQHESSQGEESETVESVKVVEVTVDELFRSPCKRGRRKRKASETTSGTDEASAGNEVKSPVEEKPSPGSSCKRILRSSSIKDVNIDNYTSSLPEKKRSRSGKANKSDAAEESTVPASPVVLNLDAEHEVQSPISKESDVESASKSERSEQLEVPETVSTVNYLTQPLMPPCTVTTDISLKTPTKAKVGSVECSTVTENLPNRLDSASDKFGSAAENVAMQISVESSDLPAKVVICDKDLCPNRTTDAVKTLTDLHLPAASSCTKNLASERPSVSDLRTRDLQFERMSSKNPKYCLVIESEEDFKPDYDEDDKPDQSSNIFKRTAYCGDLNLLENSGSSNVASAVCCDPSKLSLSASEAELDEPEAVSVDYSNEHLAATSLDNSDSDSSILLDVESDDSETEYTKTVNDNQIMARDSVVQDISEHSSDLHSRSEFDTHNSDENRCLEEKMDAIDDLEGVQVQTNDDLSCLHGSSEVNLESVADSEIGSSETRAFKVGIKSVLGKGMELPEMISKKQKSSVVQVTNISLSSSPVEPKSPKQPKSVQIHRREVIQSNSREDSVEPPLRPEVSFSKKTFSRVLLQPGVAAVSSTLTVTKTEAPKAPESTSSACSEVARPRIRLKRPWKASSAAVSVAFPSPVISKEEINQFMAVRSLEPKPQTPSLGRNNPASVEAVSPIQTSPVTYPVVSPIQNSFLPAQTASLETSPVQVATVSPASNTASAIANPNEGIAEDFLEGDVSGEEECFNELMSNSSAVSRPGSGLNSSFLTHLETENHPLDPATNPQISCSVPTLSSSSELPEELTEELTEETFRHEPSNVSCEQDSSAIRTSEFVDELVVENYGSDFDDDSYDYRDNSSTKDRSSIPKLPFLSVGTETKTLNDEVAESSISAQQQNYQDPHQKHDSQIDAQEPSSFGVCKTGSSKALGHVAPKISSSSVKGGSSVHAKHKEKKKKSAGVLIKRTGNAATIPSLLDFKPQLFSGLQSRHPDINKNIRGASSFNSEPSNSESFLRIKGFAEKEDWRSLADFFLFADQNQLGVPYFVDCLMKSGRIISQSFEKFMTWADRSISADSLPAMRQILGVIGISVVEKCTAPNDFSVAFDVLKKMLERKIHFYQSATHTESAGNIVKTAVDIFMNVKRYDLISSMLTEFNYFRCLSDVKRGNVELIIERKYCCLNAVLVEIHRHVTSSKLSALDGNKIPLCRTGIVVLEKILVDWKDDVKIQPRVTRLLELCNILDLLVSGCICQKHSSGLAHLSVLQERHPELLYWKKPTLHAVVDFFLRQDMVNFLLSDDVESSSFLRLAFQHNLLPKWPDYIPFGNNVLTLWSNLSAAEMKLVICAYMKSIVQRMHGSHLAAISWNILVTDSALSSRAETSIAFGMATLQKFLKSYMTSPLNWTLLSSSCVCFDPCTLSDIKDVLFNFGVMIKAEPFACAPESRVFTLPSLPAPGPEIVPETGDVDFRKLPWNKKKITVESKTTSELSSRHKYEKSLSNPFPAHKSTDFCSRESESNSPCYQQFTEPPRATAVLSSGLKSSSRSKTTRMNSEDLDKFIQTELHSATHQMPILPPRDTGNIGKQSSPSVRKVLLKTPQGFKERPQLLQPDASVSKQSVNLNVSAPAVWQLPGAINDPVSATSLPLPSRRFSSPFSTTVPPNQQMHRNALAVGNTFGELSDKTLTARPLMSVGVSYKLQSPSIFGRNLNQPESQKSQMMNSASSRSLAASSDFAAKSAQKDQRLLPKDKKKPDLFKSRKSR